MRCVRVVCKPGAYFTHSDKRPLKELSNLVHLSRTQKGNIEKNAQNQDQTCFTSPPPPPPPGCVVIDSKCISCQTKINDDIYTCIKPLSKAMERELRDHGNRKRACVNRTLCSICVYVGFFFSFSHSLLPRCRFTSTETIRDGSPGRPPRFSHSF